MNSIVLHCIRTTASMLCACILVWTGVTDVFAHMMIVFAAVALYLLIDYMWDMYPNSAQSVLSDTSLQLSIVIVMLMYWGKITSLVFGALWVYVTLFGFQNGQLSVL